MTGPGRDTLRLAASKQQAVRAGAWYGFPVHLGKEVIPVQLSGGCRCGAVRYRILAEPVLVCGCCCTDCAEFTGSYMTVWVGLHAPMIEFPEEFPVMRVTSPISERGHCGTCNTPLTFRRIREEAKVDPLFYVTADSLDDPGLVEVSEIIYYDQRPAGFEVFLPVPRHGGPSPDYGSKKRHGKLN